jgi:hypothetical protein
MKPIDYFLDLLIILSTIGYLGLNGYWVVQTIRWHERPSPEIRLAVFIGGLIVLATLLKLRALIGPV